VILVTGGMTQKRCLSFAWCKDLFVATLDRLVSQFLLAKVGLFTARIYQGFHRVDILAGVLLRMSVVTMPNRLNLDCM